MKRIPRIEKECRNHKRINVYNQVDNLTFVHD